MPVKNNMTDVRLLVIQYELMTLSKWARDSVNRVYDLWSRAWRAIPRGDTYVPAPARDSRLIIVSERGAEHDACDAVKYGDPLSEGAFLTIDLRYSDRVVIGVEVCLHDPLLGCVFNVLYRRDIIFRGNSLSLGKKATYI
jgi:hypothetical protein